ncbi:MAG: methionyl-tRNA formyltransferase [Corynebacterium sp.]|nr:methionyl-tRNA formyltransferase [Corynebacterium sp.]
MNIVFAGTPEPAVVALARLLDSEHNVVGVITRPDAPRGRGRTLHPSPVAAFAAEHGLQVWRPENLDPKQAATQELLAELKALDVQCIPVVAYGQLLRQEVIDAIEYGWLNLHYSLLPQWRGAAPVQAAIQAGQKETGVSVFRIDSGLDTGDILGQATAEIRPTDTADELLTRLSYQGADLLVEVLDAIAAGTAVARPQAGDPSYASKITTADARIDWEQPAANVDQHIRAMTPGPGAWTMWGERRVKITGPAVPTEQGAQLAPGEVHISKQEVLVGTASSAVALTHLQLPGKKRMNAADWARGLQPADKEGMQWQ